MSINMETFKMVLGLSIIISLIIILVDIVKRIEILENTLPSYINKLVKNNNMLLKSNNALYKKIEKLSETNTRNEMEKEDEKSFINILYWQVKINNDNITYLFEFDGINGAKINKMEEDIETLFTTLKNNETNYPC
jgi:hypothetical protein